MRKVIAAHALVLLELADEGLNGRAASHIAFYLRVMRRFWPAV
jgi:hypothetical protein